MVNEMRLVELFTELCRINSPSRAEADIVEVVRARLLRMGLTVKEDTAGAAVGGNANNLITTLPATDPSQPRLFFSAHFDTVEPTPEITIVKEGGTIRTDGRTVLGADDKAGMAAIIEGIDTLIESDIPHGQIQLLFTVCEEVGLLGAAHLDRSLVDSDFGFVFDTSRPLGDIILGAPTHDVVEFTVRGRAAHAGNAPERGVNAINVAAQAIARMRAGRIDEETTANVGVIRGGTMTNVVCPEVTVLIEARSRDSGKLDAQVSHIEQRFEEAAREAGAFVDAHRHRHYAGYTWGATDLLPRIAERAATAICLNPNYRFAGGGSDANIYNASGLPALVVSTAMNEIHTHQENILVSELVRNAEYVIALVQAASDK